MNAIFFKPSELSCSCGCGANITPALLALLNAFRAAYNHPILVSSGARCAINNKKYGGRPKSAHLVGRAVDVVRTPELLAFCTEENLRKYGLYMEHPDSTPQWLHLSNRPFPSWKPGKSRVFRP